MDYKSLPIGVSDFADLITNGSYYVDKTLMIKDIIDSGSKVTLFTRPRRFGKTLNMSMLKYFFEDAKDYDGNKKDWSYVFDGLDIMNAGEKYTSRMGKYPVIYLTFKDAKKATFEESYQKMVREIASEFERHSILLGDSRLIQQADKLEVLMRQKAGQGDYEDSILFLSECLERYCGRKAVIIIDEYDVPLENAFSCGFYQKMVGFIRSLFESGLKDNNSLAFAVITGCLRVSKESIFTGMNNLSIISICNNNFGEYFGFTVPEVEEMCRYYGQEHNYAAIKDWYDGYTFGQTDIYNPWSVISYLYDVRTNDDWMPRSYWANTSSNSIVRKLIDRADDAVRGTIEELIAGGTIEVPIHEDITYGEIYDNMDNLWNFMFFTGYFRRVNERMEGKQIYVTLKIPNNEVLYIFEEKVRSWFRDQMKDRDMAPLYTAFVNKDCAALKEVLDDIFEETISYMDQNEFYYHGMVAGLLTGIKGFSIRSNREGGKGRSDLFVKPIRKSREAFVIEFKVAHRIGEMETKAEEALAQIADRKYDEELRNDGYDRVSCYGIAFCGKECCVRVLASENGI